MEAFSVLFSVFFTSEEVVTIYFNYIGFGCNAVYPETPKRLKPFTHLCIDIVVNR